jgi:hypothetical protein
MEVDETALPGRAPIERRNNGGETEEGIVDFGRASWHLELMEPAISSLLLYQLILIDPPAAIFIKLTVLAGCPAPAPTGRSEVKHELRRMEAPWRMTCIQHVHRA